MNSPDNMHLLSIDKEFKYLFFNNMHSRTMQEIWKIQPEIGVNIFDQIPDAKQRDQIKTFYDKSIQGEIVRQTSEVFDQTGNKQYFDYISAPIINAEGEIDGNNGFYIQQYRKRNGAAARKKIARGKRIST